MKPLHPNIQLPVDRMAESIWQPNGMNDVLELTAGTPIGVWLSGLQCSLMMTVPLGTISDPTGHVSWHLLHGWEKQGTGMGPMGRRPPSPRKDVKGPNQGWGKLQTGTQSRRQVSRRPQPPKSIGLWGHSRCPSASVSIDSETQWTKGLPAVHQQEVTAKPPKVSPYLIDREISRSLPSHSAPWISGHWF